MIPRTLGGSNPIIPMRDMDNPEDLLDEPVDEREDPEDFFMTEEEAKGNHWDAWAHYYMGPD